MATLALFKLTPHRPLRLSALGQKLPRRLQFVVSDLPPKAAAGVGDQRVRFGSLADIRDYLSQNMQPLRLSFCPPLCQIALSARRHDGDIHQATSPPHAETLCGTSRGLNPFSRSCLARRRQQLPLLGADALRGRGCPKLRDRRGLRKASRQCTRQRLERPEQEILGHEFPAR
jgi:hypothetical protein